jgi:hypothetical protein
MSREVLLFLMEWIAVEFDVIYIYRRISNPVA